MHIMFKMESYDFGQNAFEIIIIIYSLISQVYHLINV